MWNSADISFSFRNLGSMDQVRFESDFSHSYSHGCIKSPTVCYAQWAQYMEITYFTCPTERQRKLHVPSEYGPDEIAGKPISRSWKIENDLKKLFRVRQPESGLEVRCSRPECEACTIRVLAENCMRRETLHSGAY